jgi:hypothetical protein
MPKHLSLVSKIAITMFVLASLILVGVVHMDAMPFSKVTRSDVIFFIAFDAVLFLAGVSLFVYLILMRLQLKPSWALWLRYLSITFFVIGAFPYIVLEITMLLVTWPPLHVFAYGTPELKALYGKCQTIKKGQTIDEVSFIMSKFQIVYQTPTDLYFNTPNYLTYGCGVHFSHEAVPHVVSTEFILD